MDKTAIISEIQSYSINDGPGIRSTVFFKGCTLKCKWCSNPELINTNYEILYKEQLCENCGKCVEICPRGALKTDVGKIAFNRDHCDACGKCVDACLVDAFELIGKNYTSDELVNVLLRDKVYYDTSGGGVTFSGGEPLLHIDFLRETSLKLKKNGIHAAIETAGNVAEKVIDNAIEFIDLFLYDIKLLDSSKHKKYTGSGNEQIIKNILKISEAGQPIIARLLIIPGINNGEDAIRRIDFIRSLKSIVQVDLLKYHRLSEGKYIQLGQKYELDYIDEDDKSFEQEIKDLYEYCVSLGLKTTIGG